MYVTKVPDKRYREYEYSLFKDIEHFNYPARPGATKSEQRDKWTKPPERFNYVLISVLVPTAYSR